MKKLAIILMMVSLFLTSCNTGTVPLEGKDLNKLAKDDIMDKGPEKGGTINLFSTRPDTLNPILTTNIYMEEYLSFIFEPLIALDETQHATPVLSDRWEFTPDGLMLNMHIRDNVTWQDGNPLTAYDVEFTFETILNAAVPTVYKKNLESVASYTAVDRSNFRIMLKAPNTLITELLTFPVIPKHYYAGSDIIRLDAPQNMKPMGSGPYALDSFDQTIHLKANAKWWNTKKKTDSALLYPLIDEVNIKIYEGSKDSVDAFIRKEIDVVPVDIRESSKYSIRADTILRKFPGRNFDFIAFNNTRGAFVDKSLKQAMSMVLEREKVLDEIMPGEGTVADIPVMPDAWIAEGDINFVRTDIEKAKKILDDNGWKDFQGVRSKKIGYTTYSTKFELIVNNDNKKRLLIAEKIKSQLQQIGIIITITIISWEDMTQFLADKNYEMALTGVKISSVPDISFMYASTAVGGALNYSGYSNPVVDQNLALIKTEIDSMKQRKLFAEMTNILLDEMPYLGICFYNNAMLFSKRVRGNINPHVWNRYNDISEWYLIKQ